jgi:hypothetical protein
MDAVPRRSVIQHIVLSSKWRYPSHLTNYNCRTPPPSWNRSFSPLSRERRRRFPDPTVHRRPARGFFPPPTVVPAAEGVEDPGARLWLVDRLGSSLCSGGVLMEAAPSFRRIRCPRLPPISTRLLAAESRSRRHVSLAGRSDRRG